MFSKFKKFALMFVFCMSLFSVTAFADTTLKFTIKDGSDTSTYTIKTDNDGLIYYPISSSDGRIKLAVKNISDTVANVTFGVYAPYALSPGAYSTFGSYDYSSNVKIYITKNGELKEVLSGDNPFEVKPVEESLIALPTEVLAQVKIILPVAIVALSILLVKSLVPRLVRLFL